MVFFQARKKHLKLWRKMNDKQIKRRATGQWGEKKAAAYLQMNGVRIIASNVRTPFGEIDLIGEDEDQLVFIEVKTLRKKPFGEPEISVTIKKQSHMIDSALSYLQKNDLLERQWRIDVVSLHPLERDRIEYHWFKNAIHN